MPLEMIGNVRGRINGMEFGPSKLNTKVTKHRTKVAVNAFIDNIPQEIGT